MAACKKPVGKGTVCYPCVVTAEHDGPCMSNESQPSQRARAAWLLAIEEEAAFAASGKVTTTVVVEDGREHRPLPHPDAPSLSDFQGPARTSATGLMEHVEEGISSPAPLTTTDTNAPGQGRTIKGTRPRTIWAGEPVAVNGPSNPEAPLAGIQPEVEYCSVCGLVDHSAEYKHPSVEPTKQREGDQPLPVVTDGVFVQDLVIEDIEARKETGIQRYGTPLQAFNGRNVDQDLYEELIDATTYLRQKLVERQALNDSVVGLTRLLEDLLGPDLPEAAWEYLNTLYAGTKSG